MTPHLGQRNVTSPGAWFPAAWFPAAWFPAALTESDTSRPVSPMQLNAEIVMASRYSDTGATVELAQSVRVNGGDGAVLEYTRTLGTQRRTTIKVVVPDAAHRLWGVSCEGQESTRIQLRNSCVEITKNFRSLPRATG